MRLSLMTATKSDSSTTFDSRPDPVQSGRMPCSPPSPVLPLRGGYLPVKWMIEYLLAIILFTLAIPILLVAAILIKATSEGPVFYLQTRVGKRGKLFRVIKLRTMVNNAEGK